MRIIQLPAELLHILLAHRLQQQKQRPNADWNPDGWMFPSPTGRLRDPSNVNCAINNMYARAGIDQRGLHPLRHTAGTVAHEVGVDIKTVIPCSATKAWP